MQTIYPHTIDLQHRNVEEDLFCFFLSDPDFQHAKKLGVIMIPTATFYM